MSPSRMPFLAPLVLRAFVSLLVAALLACAVNPQSGRREVILVSEEKEKEIDSEAARQIEEQIGLVQDPKLTEYVEALGQELSTHALRQNVDYVFNVAEMEEPNAFALPGGHIYVSRGLLVLSNSEAELANVLGHEIGHVTSRHAAQRESKAITTTVLTILSAVAAAAAGRGDVAAGVAQFGVLGRYGLIAAYGRAQEREADGIGQELSVLAGIDPAGMADFLRQLDGYTRLTSGASRLPSFFDTHPATPERVAETVTNAEVLRRTSGFSAPTSRDGSAGGREAMVIGRPGGQGFSIAPTREAYLALLDGLVIGAPASEGVFVENLFLHADMGFSLRFPPGWTKVNQRSQVMAVAPNRDAIVELQLQGTGTDPREAGATYADQEGIRLSSLGEVKIGDLPGFRARAYIDGPYGPSAAEITWVAFRGRIFRLTSWSPRSHFARYEGTFRSFARRFRAITDEERLMIDELRLRSVAALPGESLASLSQRSNNEWDLNETAVANAWVVGKPLTEGFLVKIAHREPYRAKVRDAETSQGGTDADSGAGDEDETEAKAGAADEDETEAKAGAADEDETEAKAGAADVESAP